MKNVTTRALVDEIAGRTGLTKKAVRSVLAAMTDAISENLATGGRVEIRGLASFNVGDRAPRIARNPQTGKKMLVPMSRRVRVRVARAIRRRVAEATLSTGAGLLVARADDKWAGEIRDRLGEIGYELAVGPTLRKALASSRRKPRALSFVMVGPSIGEETYAEIAQAVKLSPATAMLPVVLGRKGAGSLSRPKTVQVMPDATFASPAGAAELVRAEAERWREEKLYFGRQVTLRSPSAPPAIERLKEMLEDFYGDAFSDESEAYKTLSAFREAIDNAAQHGNGGSPQKYLTVTLMQDARRVTVDVKDEGRGFAPEVFAASPAGEPRPETGAPTDIRAASGGGRGLGLRLMRECADEVRYAEGGTRVTLVKRREGAG